MEWGQIAVQFGTTLAAALAGGGVVAAVVSYLLDRRNYARLRVDAIVDQVRGDVLTEMKALVAAHWRLLTTTGQLPDKERAVSELTGIERAKLYLLTGPLNEARLSTFYLPGPVMEALSESFGAVLDAERNGATAQALYSTLFDNQHRLVGVCRRMRQALAPLPKTIEDDSPVFFEHQPRYDQYLAHRGSPDDSPGEG